MGEMNKKVDFIICGVQKAGTTALDAYLREHPEVCMADKKEVHFFDNENYFKNGRTNYKLYHSYFSNCSGNKLIGESTPIYSYWNNAPKRIWEYNPEIKLILLLRNPIERAYSHWNMEQSRGAEMFSFSDAIRKEPERCRQAYPYQHRVYSYIDRGFYTLQLQELYKYFQRKQLLTLKNEDLKNKPKEMLDKICDFLGIDRQPNIENKNVHAIPYQNLMKKSDKVFLREIYEDEIHNLGKMLDWDCTNWLDK